jgi:outer membrane immunogenic protein
MKALSRVLLGCLAAGALSVSAHAADMAPAPMPMKAIPMPAPIWSWTGFYIGGHVGAGWGTSETSLTSFSAPIIDAINDPISLAFAQNSRSGFLGGAQAGYNWQSGWAVFGVQADIAGMDIKGTTPCLLLLSCTDKSNWLATASGRIGAVALDRILIYAKGGAAWMNTKHTVDTPNFGLGIPIPNQVVNGSGNNWGWLVGLGTEYMISKNWTAFVEYDYIQFQKSNETFPLNLGTVGLLTGPISVSADIKNTMSIAKVGVNYKFDWGY